MRSAKSKLEEMLMQHVPVSAVTYCLSLWERVPFHFKITRKRLTKQGDYRFDYKDGHHNITVNGDLNEYSFLITYIHEYGHLEVQVKSVQRAAPHGREWQDTFRKLMLPLLHDSIFPDGILRALSNHMRRPKASTQSDWKLMAALMEYEDHGDRVLLDNLEGGSYFVLQGRLYEKKDSRRTRVLCAHVKTGKRYLIPKIALVTAYQDVDSDC